MTMVVEATSLGHTVRQTYMRTLYLSPTYGVATYILLGCCFRTNQRLREMSVIQDKKRSKCRLCVSGQFVRFNVMRN